MTQDEIIEMARASGFMPAHDKRVQHFAKLVAAKEREDIARYCIWLNDEAGYTDGYDFANAIRIQGQK